MYIICDFNQYKYLDINIYNLLLGYLHLNNILFLELLNQYLSKGYLRVVQLFLNQIIN